MSTFSSIATLEEGKGFGPPEGKSLADTSTAATDSPQGASLPSTETDNDTPQFLRKITKAAATLLNSLPSFSSHFSTTFSNHDATPSTPIDATSNKSKELGFSPGAKLLTFGGLTLLKASTLVESILLL